MREVEQIDLVDASGESHHYVTTLHKASVGRKLLAQIMLAIEGAASSVVGTDGAIQAILAGGADAVGILRPVVDLLLDDDAFYHKLFTHVARDGVNFDPRLADGWYRGNYGEMLDTMLWLIMVDFIAPLSSWVPRLTVEHPVISQLVALWPESIDDMDE